MFKVNNENTRATTMESFWCFYCYLLSIFYTFFRVSFRDFEQVNLSWPVAWVNQFEVKDICIEFVINNVSPQSNIVKIKLNLKINLPRLQS